jgi:serine phosphatase RsbU (regulator of sigma subunit)
MALGIDNGDVFDRITGDLSVPLERDDCLVLYTDGVTEMLDANGDEFGPETNGPIRPRQRERRSTGSYRPPD